jgi:putative sterol carrier protein
MPGVFNPESAQGVEAVIGFHVSGIETFDAYLVIKEGVCTLHEEPPKEPDLVIETPSDVWLAIAGGELDGQSAFAQRAYKAKGNLGILMRMSRMFNNSDNE